MNAEAIIARLERFPAALEAAAACVPAEDARWRPESGNWSILEVVCHMADEDVEDFRARLELLMLQPGTAWPPLNLEGVSEKRGYLQRDLRAELARFTAKRRENVAWLRSLGAADWTRAYPHPKQGPVPAGELLVSWVAHDALHLRQIAKRLWELASRDAPEYKTVYAGEWKA